ncbi:hypothetical protein J7E97_10980 [Streptomyces sp. ISL-66]|uniref:hypothetical protein n=1 Tax=Streptomyces sp. ISL-66 TaxID=2819186 RepID=UPI001BE9539E|nr:hypothetical protein [Streptomyces sp. ISL-66]MBT2468387.1 hypothetical protein [Streptomyces sp. ISL-66]
MHTYPPAASRWARRCAVTATALAVVGVGVAPVATADAAPAGLPAQVQSAPAGLDKAPEGLYLFQYTYRGHLKIGGGNFTLGGKVYVVVKYNTGKIRYEGNVFAKTNPGVPDGAAYLETNISAPCAPGNNGYARAYDYNTETWSPKLPVAICQRID